MLIATVARPVVPAILFFLLITITGACSKGTAPAKSDAPRNASYRTKVVSVTNMNVDIINYVNEHRRTKGLSPLKVLSIASIEAAKHSQQMAVKKVKFGHDGFKQRAVAIANELKGTTSTGENVATGKMTAREVVNEWLKSAAHKANIEGKFDYTGVGVAKNSSGVVYYTQIFVKK
jgi:uncharacterized protein YkwD